MQKQKSIIIIGAGVAGLAAGCYAQMNGYRSEIFELHYLPGGLCTAWQRKGYTFDGCLHWLMGSAPDQPLNRMWQELGAVQGRRFINHDELVRIEGEGGKALIVYTNIDRLEQHLKELAPADAAAIEQFCHAARQYLHFDMAVERRLDMLGLRDVPVLAAKMGPVVLPTLKWMRLSVRQYAERFSDPFLRWAFPQMFWQPDIPLVAALGTLAYLHNLNAGYPIGGSLAFARAIEQRYRELGGRISYKDRVCEKIIVERGRAAGVRLADGSERRADIVISAADGQRTLFNMLEGEYVSSDQRRFYDEMPVAQPMIQVSLGVARDMAHEPHWIMQRLEQPTVIAGQVYNEISVKHFCFDPSLAPAGKSVVEVLLPSKYRFWRRLYDDRPTYNEAKKQAAHNVIALLEQRFPGISSQIEVIDVATPVTYKRYTDNWRGSNSGWSLTTKTMNLKLALRGIRKTLPGLRNFYMAGQWVEPGGSVPMAAISGRNAMRMICRDDRRPFLAWTPAEQSIGQVKSGVRMPQPAR